MSVFREEALRRGAESPYGPIVLARSWPSWVSVLAAVLIGSSICGYLILGSYTKRSTAVGLIVPTRGTIRIFPAAPGMVTQGMLKKVNEYDVGNCFSSCQMIDAWQMRLRTSGYPTAKPLHSHNAVKAFCETFVRCDFCEIKFKRDCARDY